MKELNQEAIEMFTPESDKPVIVNQPATFIEMAIKQGLGIEHLEKLMDLQERWNIQQAKKAFDEAMTIFQSKCPLIKKRKAGAPTKTGQVAYYYAPIEDIVEQTKDLIGECGFSYMIKTPPIPDGVEVHVIVKHKEGHQEESVVKMPFVAKTGVMSDPQVTGATMTYAKRYCFCNAFGIMTADTDTDAITVLSRGEFEALIKDWQYVGYTKQVEATIEGEANYKIFLENLPQREFTEQFLELVKLIPEAKRQYFWEMFQKQTKLTISMWLLKLKESLNKTKKE